MASVSRRQRLIDFLAHHENQRARRSTIVASLAPRWMTAEQALETIDRACADPTCDVTAGKGGTVTYWGTEIGSRVALYSSVERIVTDYWGPRTMGLRNVSPARPHAGPGAGEGSWTRPDLVVFADPRRRQSATDPRETHALEIEQRNGFDVRSVYQAFEQGRGANYSWVFAHSDDADTRVMQAADDVGVGIVVFTNPSAFGTYRTLRRAIRRQVHAAERQHFLKCCGVPDIGNMRTR